MKTKLGGIELELIQILKKYRKEHNIPTQSEAEKALENGTRSVEEQILLWNLGDIIVMLREEFEHIDKNGNKKVGISQRELAKRLVKSCTATNLRRIEKGERSTSLITINRVLKALNVPLKDVIPDAEYNIGTHWMSQIKFYSATENEKKMFHQFENEIHEKWELEHKQRLKESRLLRKK
jgi:transcriptional regulator with XRE-family HTH domain